MELDDKELEGIDLDDITPWDISWNTDMFRKQEDVRDDYVDTTPQVNEDDYQEEEAMILKALKGMIRDACNVNTTWSRRKKALNWCFVRGERTNKGLDFHNACLALGARPEVIQARLQHQLYTAGIPLRDPLPFMADPIPEQYESEAIMAAWEDGASVIKEVWRWPGIPIQNLEERLKEGGLDREPIPEPYKVMEKLERAGLLAWRFGFVFLTGRAPDRIARRNFSWSKSFF